MHTAKQVIKTAIENGTVQHAYEYAEPGYSDPETGILFADWNERTHHNPETREYVVIDNTMSRLAKIAERAGYEIEWSDEWTTCGACYKAIRTKPDSYSWQPSFFVDDVNCELICHECFDPSVAQ